MLLLTAGGIGGTGTGYESCATVVGLQSLRGLIDSVVVVGMNR